MSESQAPISPIPPKPLGQSIFLGTDGLLRPLWRVALFVCAGGVALTAVSRGLGALVHRFPALGLETFRFGSNFRYLAINAALLLVTALFIRVCDRRSFRTLGLWFYAGWAKEAGLGALCGVGIIAVTVGGLVASGGVAFSGLANGLGVWLRGGSITAIFVLLAAAAEEIAFRGYAFQRLVDSIGKLGAVLVLSALFGAVHMNNPAATPLSTANTVLAGVLLAVAYLKTRGLWVPIGLHWAWNFFLGPVFGVPVSGFRSVFEPYLFRAQVAGPEWLTGASYGPEGSIILTVACIAAIVWMASARRLSPSPAMAEALK